mmetsp:Transcript_12648/g.29915  ORF Transcript_12648/g.29915 Transcript_12648/m.29915 type:complete len:80 (-) Transcript_12648:77-316(-)
MDFVSPRPQRGELMDRPVFPFVTDNKTRKDDVGRTNDRRTGALGTNPAERESNNPNLGNTHQVYPRAVRETIGDHLSHF